jgi:hypothetical protein
MYAAAIARTVLMAKSPAARAFARTITKGKHHPHSVVSRQKLSEGLRRLYAMDAQARREHLAAKRSRWLTDCLVTQGDRKVFDLTCKGDAGSPVTVHIEMPVDASLLDFLLLIMRSETAPLVMRIDAAKNACLLMYERKARVVVEDHR